MLEGCTDILACEELLAGALKNVRLIGQVPLTDNDIENLSNLVKQTISSNVVKGTRYLKAKAPTSLVFSLVCLGRYYDKDLGFWPVVEQKIGLSELNWQVKWGKFFLEFINKNHLPKFDEEIGLTYVTPILGHVCVPESCLDEYFERILFPLVQRELLNPHDRDEIIFDLKMKREISQNRLRLERQRKELDDDLKAIQKDSKAYKNRLDKYQAIASLLVEEEECQKRGRALTGLEDAKSTKLRLLKRINVMTNRLRELNSEEKQLLARDEFKKQYQSVFDNKSKIEDVIHNYRKLEKELVGKPERKEFPRSCHKQLEIHFFRTLNNTFGTQTSQLDLTQLNSLLVHYQKLQEQKKQFQEDMENSVPRS